MYGLALRLMLQASPCYGRLVMSLRYSLLFKVWSTWYLGIFQNSCEESFQDQDLFASYFFIRLRHQPYQVNVMKLMTLWVPNLVFDNEGRSSSPLLCIIFHNTAPITRVYTFLVNKLSRTMRFKSSRRIFALIILRAVRPIRSRDLFTRYQLLSKRTAWELEIMEDIMLIKGMRYRQLLS